MMEWRLNLTDEYVCCSNELVCMVMLPCGLRMALYAPGRKLSYIPETKVAVNRARVLSSVIWIRIHHYTMICISEVEVLLSPLVPLEAR